MSSWEVRLAGPADHGGILQLQSRSMEGPIRISLLAPLKGSDRAVLGFRDGQLMGMGMRIRTRHRWASESHWVGVLTSFRSICSPLPRRTVMEMYRLLRSAPASDEPPWELTAILEENKPARRLLEAGLRGMPQYSPVAHMTTLTFKVTAKPLKFPANVNESENQSGIDGSASYVERILDRRTVVTGYTSKLAWVRPMINPALKLAGYPVLPRPGSVLNDAYVANVEWPPRNRLALELLIKRIHRRAGELGADLVHWGIPSGHPDVAWLKSKLHAWETRSIVYAVHDPEIPFPHLPNFRPEISRL